MLEAGSGEWGIGGVSDGETNRLEAEAVARNLGAHPSVSRRGEFEGRNAAPNFGDAARPRFRAVLGFERPWRPN